MKRTIATTGAAAAVLAGPAVTAPTASAADGPNTRDAVSWRRIHHPSGGGACARL